ncbi:cytochrome-c oxidase [Pannonibacter phragmitetus]|uniref:cytochrome-c oxidase n=1 Tax=Pannonibacter phragmitetus TaxID=121719 RepID=UPI000F03B530|nr:cytochrome-c oxidase [Pannonibacter phragmitetus]
MTGFGAPFRPACLPGLARFQFRAATFYLMAGLLLGIVMAAGGDFTLKGVHGHMHLLGWVTLALTGTIYALAPHLAEGALARWHVILHNLGLPIMLVALTAYLWGMTAAEPGIAAGAMLSTLGLGAFTLAVWRAL